MNGMKDASTDRATARGWRSLGSGANPAGRFRGFANSEPHQLLIGTVRPSGSFASAEIVMIVSAANITWKF